MPCDGGRSHSLCHPACLRTEGWVRFTVQGRECRPFSPLRDETLVTPLGGQNQDQRQGHGEEMGGKAGKTGEGCSK